MDGRNIDYKHEDRQWDIRINVQSDEYLKGLIYNIKDQWEQGKLKYILIGGLEIGTKPTQGDYQIRHIHIAAIFHNRCSKAAIIKNWGIIEGNGYYLVPRNRDLPYAGWRNHHIKKFSKIDKDEILIFEAGELPKDEGKGIKRKTEPSELEKKETTDTILKKIRTMLEEDQDEQAFQLYPRTFIQYGERLKTLIKQKKPTCTKHHPHIWLHGFPGTGKTAIMSFIYPKMYKKDLNNRFFDLYDQHVHTHVMLEDLDHQNVEKLGIQFLKTLCDEAGFPIGMLDALDLMYCLCDTMNTICRDCYRMNMNLDQIFIDQKYKTPQLAKTSVLVTSNFTIDAVVPEGKGVDETKMALHRRFLQLRVDQLLQFLGLKLIPTLLLATRQASTMPRLPQLWRWVTVRRQVLRPSAHRT